MSTLKKLVRGSAARTLQTLVSIAAGVITLPIMLSQLGEDLYGLWVLVGGFTASLYLFDFGFASAVSRYVSKAISRHEHSAANGVINSAIIVYSLLALLILVSISGIALSTPLFVDDIERVGLIRTLILITGFTIAIEFPFKAFSGIAVAHLRHDLISISGVLIKVSSTVALVYLLYSGYELVAVAWLGLLTGLASNLAFLWIARHVYPFIEISRGFVSTKIMKELFSYSLWAFVIDISRIAKQKSDIFIIGAFLTTSLLAVYYVAVRLCDYTMQFLNRATNMSTPVFVEQLANKRYAEAEETLLLFLRINFMTGLLAFSCFVTTGEHLIRAWMGPRFDVHSTYVVLILLLCGRTAAYIVGPFQSLLFANATHRSSAIMNIVEVIASSLLMVGSALWLDLGLVGIAAGSAVPPVLMRLLVLPVLARRVLPIPKRRVIASIAGPSIFFGLAVGVGLLLNMKLDLSVWGSLFTVGGSTAFSYVLLCSIFLTNKERAYARRLLRRRPL